MISLKPFLGLSLIFILFLCYSTCDGPTETLNVSFYVVNVDSALAASNL